MSYPWNSGDALNHNDLNAAIALCLANAAAAQATASNAFNLATTSVATLGPPRPISATVNWPAAAVTNGTYILSATTPYALSALSVDAGIGSNGGSLQFTFRANGVVIGNLSGVSVSLTSKTNTVAVSQPSNPLLVGVGSILDVVIQVTGGTPIDAYVCLNASRLT